MPGDLSLQALGAQLALVPELPRDIRTELQGIRLAVDRESPLQQSVTKNELLTTAQVAEILGLSEGTLTTWRCTKRYDVPYLKLGRHVRYKRGDVETWVRSQQLGTTP
jgi:excisionase family DNA binding protein